MAVARGFWLLLAITVLGAVLRQAGIPVSSIGPNPGSCLDKLHRYPAIATLIDTDAETTP